MAAGRPGIGRGASEPVARSSSRYRRTVARPTRKVRATSDCGRPAATARTIRSLKSKEYALMPKPYTTRQPFRKTL